MNEHNPADDTACRDAARALDEARRPAERSAALVLAVAQRDLAIARASSPAAIVGEPAGVSDPDAAYAAREDVLGRWPHDDQAAAAALAARFTDPERGA